MWQSVHIDDLRPAQLNRPEVSTLIDVDLLELFEKDHDVQSWLVQENDEGVAMESVTMEEEMEEGEDDVDYEDDASGTKEGDKNLRILTN